MNGRCDCIDFMTHQMFDCVGILSCIDCVYNNWCILAFTLDVDYIMYYKEGE